VLIIRRSNCIIQHLVSSHSVGGRPVRTCAPDGHLQSGSIAKIILRYTVSKISKLKYFIHVSGVSQTLCSTKEWEVSYFWNSSAQCVIVTDEDNYIPHIV